MEGRSRWVLVLNASLARILRELPAAGSPRRSELVLRATHHRLQRMIQAAGDVPRCAAGLRLTPAPTDARAMLEEDEWEFVRLVVAILEAHRRSGDFGALCVIAKPQTLARFREAMPRSLRHTIDHEIPGDLAHAVPAVLWELVRRELGRREGTAS